MLNYKAKNVDTEKALKAISEYRIQYSAKQQKEMYGVQKYYEGLNKGLDIAENIFECSNYEKDGGENDE